MKRFYLMFVLLLFIFAISGCNKADSNVSQEQSTASELTYIPELLIKTGSDIDSNSDDIQSLLSQYCKLNLSDIGNISNLYYLSSRDLSYRNDIDLKYSDYLVSFTDKTGEKNTDKYITIFYGKEKGENNPIYFIDACETDGKSFTLEMFWDKLSAHAIFGKYVGTFPSDVLSEGMTKLNMTSIIGDGRQICYTIKYTEDIAAVVSAKTNYYDIKNGKGSIQNRSYLDDIRVDLLNIADGKLVREGHTLTNALNRGYVIRGMTDDHYVNSDTGKLCFIFGANNPDSDTHLNAYYELTIDNQYKMSDALTIMSDEDLDNSIINKESKKAVSASGRYETLYKNNDLYIHDTVTGVNTLVYDSKPDVESESDYVSSYKSAKACCFVDEVLYYTVYGYEWVIENCSYDSQSKVTVHNNTKFGIDCICNGFAYGYYSDDFYGRFPLDNPNKIEKLTSDGNAIIYSDDNKFIAEIESDKNTDETQKAISTVTIYDSQTFKRINSYTLKSPFNSLRNGIFMGDYIYVISDNDQSAYKIHYK